MDSRSSDELSKRDILSFIEPRPPLISNPFMRPRPQKGTNLLELFDEDSECEEPELVQVYLRMKPSTVANNLYDVRSNRCLVTSLDTATVGHGRRTQHNVSKMYTFSHIFGPEATQKELFENIMKDNLRKLPEGHSFTLLTYGASGSGKTYTLMGTVQSPGLVPRSLEYLFRIIDAAQQPQYKPAEGGADKLSFAEQSYELKKLEYINKQIANQHEFVTSEDLSRAIKNIKEDKWVKQLRHISAPLRDKYRRMSVNLVKDMTNSTIDLSTSVKHYVWVSFVEIYNEGIYDLLVAGDRRASSTLRIREDAAGNVFVKGATHAFVRSGAEAYDVLLAGKHNLQVAATGVHAHSSRSHCIFTISVLTDAGDGRVQCAVARLCDLAGCERARKTRNVGARMQESKAINASLHVLERCLHTLRRRTRRALDTQLVPYRESKLTRLLGAGLSGARGEAVAMVVTLNPAPEYAHETKHVLQMAAVARDIQINSTVQESVLEESRAGGGEGGAELLRLREEILRLREENERLHFELLHAQSAAEQQQQRTAAMMGELVHDAKDMMRVYYEAQLQALRTQMEDMREEYEERLENAATAKPSAESPNRQLQEKITQLITEKAILEDQLAAERRAKESAENEVQYLLCCIEERDEKNNADSPASNDEGVMSLSSDDETEVSDSLDATFSKEHINRSRLLLRQSLLNNTNNRNVDRTAHESDLETSVIHDNDNTFNGQDCINDDKEDRLSSKDIADLVEESGYELAQESEIVYKTIDNDTDSLDKSNAVDTPVTVKKKDSLIRGTYFVRKSQDNASNESFNNITNNNTEQSVSVLDSSEDEVEHTNISGVEKQLPKDSFEEDSPPNMSPHSSKPHKILQTVASKLHRFTTTSSIDTSLAQFEQLEQAAKNCDSENKPEIRETFTAINALKEKKTYFYNVTQSDSKDRTLDGKNSETKRNESETEKHSILTKIAKNKMMLYAHEPNKTKEDENSAIKVDGVEVKTIVNENENLMKNRESVPAKCEEENDNQSTEFKETTKEFSDNNLLDVDRILKSKGKKTYFDNIDTNLQVNISKAPRLVELKDSTNDERSPSIVKEEVNLDQIVELDKIKKMLGDSSIRLPSANKTLTQNNKSSSMDLFESPQIIVKYENNMELVTKSIEKIITLNDKSVKQEGEIKTEPVSSTENSTNQSQFNGNVTSQNNNTVEDFENIYNNITVPRATEFDMLISESQPNATNVISEFEDLNPEVAVPKYNLRKTQVKSEPEISDDKKNKFDFEKKKFEKFTSEKIETKKYKLRSLISDEVLLEASAKCESKNTKRNLRLRRRKNQSEDDETDNLGKTKDNVVDIDDGKDKLKDIVNLQVEFSDVTMGVPAPFKEVKDIPSPEKNRDGNENMPPLAGIQSCPSKSVTRSRRKLFTPRAEPLEESITQGESNERIYVPRPSYHRPRARRKL